MLNLQNRDIKVMGAVNRRTLMLFGRIASMLSPQNGHGFSTSCNLLAMLFVGSIKSKSIDDLNEGGLN